MRCRKPRRQRLRTCGRGANHEGARAALQPARGLVLQCDAVRDSHRLGVVVLHCRGEGTRLPPTQQGPARPLAGGLDPPSWPTCMLKSLKLLEAAMADFGVRPRPSSLRRSREMDRRLRSDMPDTKSS